MEPICSPDLPKLQNVRLPRSAFIKTRTLEVNDVNPGIQFVDEHGIPWENDWPMQSLVITAVKGDYENHQCVLNAVGSPKRCITIDLKKVVNQSSVWFNKHSSTLLA